MLKKYNSLDQVDGPKPFMLPNSFNKELASLRDKFLFSALESIFCNRMKLSRALLILSLRPPVG